VGVRRLGREQGKCGGNAKLALEMWSGRSAGKDCFIREGVFDQRRVFLHFSGSLSRGKQDLLGHFLLIYCE